MQDRIAKLRFLCTAILALAIFFVFTQHSGRAADAEVVSWSGETMGTRFMVKIFLETSESISPDSVNSNTVHRPTADLSELRLLVDAELRQVNDQMSTYLKSSEITRFNNASSTDWFDVSLPVAQVVTFAQEVSQKTQGAFDITVGPLVNAWNFGPTPRSDEAPSNDQIKQLIEQIGYQNLAARLDPPSIKKTIPQLRIDLSAIAKGHGVDRVVELVNRTGYPNVFVEIGGEVRTTGSKGGKPWVVGIQAPDKVINDHDMTYPFAVDALKRSMATSGDYRNYIEIAGKRYSHTIDPRTGKPIEHKLASVSVVTESCMQADAWATAINVLGPAEGKRVAEANQLDALLIERTSQAFERIGIGAFEPLLLTRQSASRQVSAMKSISTSAETSQGFAIAVITFIAFVGILFAMAVGVIFGGKSISGSCGGLNGTKNEDGTTRCSLCSNPTDACKELREKMNTSGTV